jgi:hypothetical protein
VSDHPETEAALVQLIQAMREHPEKYESIRRTLTQAVSDEERASAILTVATSETELAALMPASLRESALVTVTTVTVTTVFILEGSADDDDEPDDDEPDDDEPDDDEPDDDEPDDDDEGDFPLGPGDPIIA